MSKRHRAGKRIYKASTPRERGKMAEEAFFAAWKNVIYPAGIVSIERPTKQEDRLEKTDAVVVCISGGNLRIQIKSFYIKAEDRIAMMEEGLIPLSVIATDTPEVIQKNTYRAIKKFCEFTKEHTEKPRCHEITPNPHAFYRGGQKMYDHRKR